MLEDLQAANKVVGVKQIKRAMSEGSAQRVFLARDADPKLTEPICQLCQASHIEYQWVGSMTELGHACGISVGAAAAAILA